ncbi:MAG: hypothetical protein NTY38_27190 [Acidobacteria bacterium]|nr:hypothetical protein [Acidobacteriota bacterium]
MGVLNAACLAAFGQDVTFRPATGAPFTVAGVLETGARLEKNAPGTYALLFIRAADLPAPPERGDEVEVGGASYKVFEIEADAGGGLKLALRLE